MLASLTISSFLFALHVIPVVILLESVRHARIALARRKRRHFQKRLYALDRRKLPCTPR